MFVLGDIEQEEAEETELGAVVRGAGPSCPVGRHVSLLLILPILFIPVRNLWSTGSGSINRDGQDEQDGSSSFEPRTTNEAPRTAFTS